MATLVVGGLAALMTGSGWVLPTGVLSALAVATISRASFGFGLRHLVIGPLYGVAKLWLPLPLQLMLTGTEVVTSSALILAGTGKTVYRGTRFIAGAAYLIIAGVVSGSVVLLRLARSDKLEDTVDRIQCLATTADPSPPLAILDPLPRSAAASSTLFLVSDGPDTLLVRSPLPSYSLPSSSAAAAPSTPASPPLPPPRLHTPDPGNPFCPTDPGLVDPRGSVADMSAVLASVTMQELAAATDARDVASHPAAASFVSSSLYPSLATLRPEMEFDDWVFVQSSMTEEQIRREMQAAAAAPQPPQEAVAQCSMAGLDTLLRSYGPEEIADIQVFQSSDSNLEHPVQTLSLDQLRLLVQSAQLSVISSIAP